MNDYTIYPRIINFNKTTICFTWDDNFTRHYEYIAPCFNNYNIRCTFYINPGEPDFCNTHLMNYKRLMGDFYEIGNHAYTHQDLTHISNTEFQNQINSALESMHQFFGRYPTTFAFPHHKYNEAMLRYVKLNHLETRNSLQGSRRFSIKSNSTIEEMQCEIHKAISENYTLIFSGHSVALNEPELSSDDNEVVLGYEPVLVTRLESLLNAISSLNDKVQVLTFEQATIKHLLFDNFVPEKDCCSLDERLIKLFTDQHISLERLRLIV